MSFLKKINKATFAWAMNDWANSVYATTVMAGFFPIFFKKYWANGVNDLDATFYLGLTNSLASIVILLIAPILGAMADQGGNRKKYLGAFTFIGILMTFALFFVGQGQWQFAFVIYILGNIGFFGSNIFYDSLLVNVSKKENRDFCSGFGFAMGYLGGGILFSLNVLMTLKPELFGIASKTLAVQYSFVTVAIWWAIFCIPLFLFVPEEKVKNKTSLSHQIKNSLKKLLTTLKSIKQQKHIFTFLLAYWLYIDAVHTIMKMAVSYGQDLGFQSDDLIKALLLTQFIGFPSAIIFGYLGQKKGPKFGLFICIFFYFLVTLWSYFMSASWEFYVLAIMIGLVQGGIQALSRSYFSTMIPQNSSAEYFGFYNMVGKFAAVIGPTLMGLVGMLSSNPRLSLIPIALMLIVGALLLAKVKPPYTSLKT